MSDKFFNNTTDLVAASMQALRVLRKHKDTESRMVYENLLVALRAMGVKQALKSLEKNHA